MDFKLSRNMFILNTSNVKHW